jgi:hypothetical protein
MALASSLLHPAANLELRQSSTEKPHFGFLEKADYKNKIFIESNLASRSPVSTRLFIAGKAGCVKPLTRLKNHRVATRNLSSKVI